MRNLRTLLCVVLIWCFLGSNCLASDWSLDQTEVLRVVAAYVEASHQRDLAAYLGFWHPEFLGWHNGDDSPTDYEARSKGLEYYFSTTRSLCYEFDPIAIQILADGEAAIIHYKIRNVLEVIETGKEVRGVSYWTDYLVRDDNRWLLISDHGGRVSVQGKPE